MQVTFSSDKCYELLLLEAWHVFVIDFKRDWHAEIVDA